MRFVRLVEGHSEKIAVPGFLRRWLNERLPQPIGIKAVEFNGWRDLVKHAPKKAKMYLNRGHDVVAVVGLMDLYGPDFYPSHTTTADERIAWAREFLEKKVDLSRFRMFFAVHELEAWLLSDPSIFPKEIGDALLSTGKPPETVDFAEPPGKLLKRLYGDKMRQTYKKVTNGQSLFARLDPNVAYEKCPELRRMLDEMLRMAQCLCLCLVASAAVISMI